jgi:hypothetical protein
MSVLTGPREEWRRILYQGTPTWVRPEGELLRLGDGRTVRDADAVYLPPCDPTKIICIHLNYESRRVQGAETGNADVLPETADHAQQPSWISQPARELQVPQLRRRDRGDRRQADAQRCAR